MSTGDDNDALDELRPSNPIAVVSDTREAYPGELKALRVWWQGAMAKAAATEPDPFRPADEEDTWLAENFLNGADKSVETLAGMLADVRRYARPAALGMARRTQAALSEAISRCGDESVYKDLHRRFGHLLTKPTAFKPSPVSVDCVRDPLDDLTSEAERLGMYDFNPCCPDCKSPLGCLRCDADWETPEDVGEATPCAHKDSLDNRQELRIVVNLWHLDALRDVAEAAEKVLVRGGHETLQDLSIAIVRVKDAEQVHTQEAFDVDVTLLDELLGRLQVACAEYRKEAIGWEERYWALAKERRTSKATQPGLESYVDELEAKVEKLRLQRDTAEGRFGPLSGSLDAIGILTRDRDTWKRRAINLEEVAAEAERMRDESDEKLRTVFKPHGRDPCEHLRPAKEAPHAWIAEHRWLRERAVRFFCKTTTAAQDDWIENACAETAEHVGEDERDLYELLRSVRTATPAQFTSPTPKEKP